VKEITVYKKSLTTRQVLEKKLGAAKASAFINGLKDIHRNSKYFSGIYRQSAMMKERLDSVTAGRR
jgi:hypothetical protein